MEKMAWFSNYKVSGYRKPMLTKDSAVLEFDRRIGIKQLSATDNQNIDVQNPFDAHKSKSYQEARARGIAKARRYQLIKKLAKQQSSDK